MRLVEENDNYNEDDIKENYNQIKMKKKNIQNIKKNKKKIIMKKKQ